ncbi:PhoX family protein [Chiayiivirga flava]|uniref:PhoX family phosphatase n=1 Tax=Chiayiivirga flava TaxID=659595 RepID=A0A7W8G0K7_9GAMM|nr:PhoX family phosphatase [Chiayiivirga flava]MBB5206750.1 hypothetical protein [Chiayiivirga flava]
MTKPPPMPTLSSLHEAEDSNRSDNRSFADVLAVHMSRRRLLRGGASLAAAGLVATPLAQAMSLGWDAEYGVAAGHKAIPRNIGARPAFQAIAVNRLDTVSVPPGYSARTFLAWGEPLFSDGPAYLDAGLNTAQEQAQQIGAHHDGIHYFPLRAQTGERQRALIAMNHEYIDAPVLHPAGSLAEDGSRTPEQIAKEIAAHGVSIVEVRETDDGVWEQVDSKRNRRITAATPMELSGPVRGHALVKTAYSPDGTATLGTVNNCGSGRTPWGTYLTTEENWAGYFVNRDAERPREQARYGVPTVNSNYRWDSAEPRFDATTKADDATGDYRNNPNTFGWMVEIDPYAPAAIPVKRTALGRFGHEGAIFPPARVSAPVVVYSGDDANNEYIYKFVSKRAYVLTPLLRPAPDALDVGTLYVARFDDDGTGQWLALDIADPAFQAAAAAAGVEFADQADVLVNTRLAADVVGATKMDRPEWGAVDPLTGMVYFTLTNNSARVAEGVDAANPRGPNPFGHIIRWREDGDRHEALRFAWDIYVLSGAEGAGVVLPGTADERPLDADNLHASPDGLWFDQGGLLWIQTDMSGSQLGEGPFGNNQMLAADPVTGDIRRFLVGPVGCEVTGICSTPDLRTLFVNIQHPTGSWPDGGDARPRSSTVIVTKHDGGIIGT